ncbi:TauD/TfdA dioxygenase family protein [Mycobacteroides chelonae]|uniref:Alpha-ketoglutarate-dependent sulfate ester dioxygenase n=1 Tax=Mycobacteroides chelonae TaxID=1774 RepID=A0A1S1MAL9_MYCCH|nr:TauD/TfdA family dioxygenase [Mycobacteroides chelonae]OHU80661.1 taurine catabolism dioxygenase [Mycobacteroides chelonae]QQG85960.1 TauD/TfdA family dioxygenase [Mycobacteroides chelonae]QQG90777.1 TauD/TfdA family dioxygenase [Mycobacteroides chelonae]
MDAIHITQLGANIGARVDGVRLGGDLDASTVESIHRAWLHHKVVFFRGQDHLNEEGHKAFAGLLGTRTATRAGAPDKEVTLLDSGRGIRANNWHTDMTYCDRPPKASLLRAVVLPPYGGATCWANTVTAYEQLPRPLRRLADELWARHDNQYDYLDVVPEQQEFRRAVAANKFVTEHPLVRVHPETGERALLLGKFVKKIVGVPSADSEALIRIFQDHITRLENTVRWNWEPGDLAMWDNRATQHYAIDDYDGQDRLMHRITLAGDIPVDVHGNSSRAIEGDASGFSPAITPAPLVAAVQ